MVYYPYITANFIKRFMMTKKTGVSAYIADRSEQRNSESVVVSSDINAALVVRHFRHYGNQVD